MATGKLYLLDTIHEILHVHVNVRFQFAPGVGWGLQNFFLKTAFLTTCKVFHSQIYIHLKTFLV
jgi:hypothetical protein